MNAQHARADALVGQICEAMKRLASTYIRQDVPHDVRATLKYTCEIQLGDALITAMGFSAECEKAEEDEQ